MAILRTPPNFFKGCLTIEEFLTRYSKRMWESGIVFVKQLSTGKIFVGMSTSLDPRVKAMQSNLKTGKMRVSYFSKELIDTTKDTKDLQVFIKLVPEDGLEDEVIRAKELLAKQGLLFERRRDCDVSEYTLFKVTHPELTNMVYFVKHKHSSPLRRSRSIFRQRAETLRQTVRRPSTLLSLAGVLRGKDSAFIDKFVFERITPPTPIVGSKSARTTLKQLVLHAEQNGQIVLNLNPR